MCQDGACPDEHSATALHMKAHQGSTPHNAGLQENNKAWLRTAEAYMFYSAPEMAREEQIRARQGKAKQNTELQCRAELSRVGQGRARQARA